MFVKGLEKKLGKDQAITNKKMRACLKETGIKVSAPRIRKIINYIRRTNLVPCLVSTSKGYFVSSDKEELENYIQSLSERAEAILAIRKALINQSSHL